MLDQPSAPVSNDIPDSVRQFCAIAEPYVADEKYDGLFIEAMRDITALHMERSPWYRRFAEQAGVKPERIRTMAAVVALPPVHANFFKQHEIRSIHESQVKTHLTSSGTTGQKSQVFFDEFTLKWGRVMAQHEMVWRGVPDERPAHYLLNGYEPYKGFTVGTSNTTAYLMSYAPAAETFWSLRYVGDGRHELDPFGADACLERWAAGTTPVRILGFPYYLFYLLERRRARRQPDLRLPAGSLVILGGGWKGHADKSIAKGKFYQQIKQQLGIEEEWVIEIFGSVEHSVPYTDCPRHHLHQPTWSRVVIRDVKTLAPVPDGTPGFLSFLSPYIPATPAHSVVMGDLAVRHPAGSCPLATYPTPWFEILGRAGTSANRSCAAAAAELLKTN